VEEAVDDAGADGFDLGGDGIGHAVFFPESDFCLRKRAKSFPQGQLKFFQRSSSIMATSVS
jgi:hypothetical protein